VCCYVPNFIKIGPFFVEIWRFNDLQYGGRPPFLIVGIWSLCRVTSIAMRAIAIFPMQNFTEIGQLAAELRPKKGFF